VSPPFRVGCVWNSRRVSVTRYRQSPARWRPGCPAVRSGEPGAAPAPPASPGRAVILPVAVDRAGSRPAVTGGSGASSNPEAGRFREERSSRATRPRVDGNGRRTAAAARLAPSADPSARGNPALRRCSPGLAEPQCNWEKSGGSPSPSSRSEAMAEGARRASRPRRRGSAVQCHGRHCVGCVLRPRPHDLRNRLRRFRRDPGAPARPPHAASCVSVPPLPLRRRRTPAPPSLRSGETSARRLLRVSTTAATPSAAYSGPALTTSEIGFADSAGTPALRRDLRTPPPACQYHRCHSVGRVLRPRPRYAPARPPHAASCVSVPGRLGHPQPADTSRDGPGGAADHGDLLRGDPAGQRGVVQVRVQMAAQHH